MSGPEQAPILVVAALRYELASINDAAHPRLALLETGEGVANAERRLESWLQQRSARAVLSIGFAGALSSALQVGDLVIAGGIHDSTALPDGTLLSAAQTHIGTAVHIGVAFTSHEILCTAESKLSLARSLGTNEIGFVDMESTGIARVCASHRLPFLIVRSISDLLHEDLPLDFNEHRTSDGRVDPKKVVSAALRRPGSFRGLFELRKRSKLCAGRLADFVEQLLPLIT